MSPKSVAFLLFFVVLSLAVAEEVPNQLAQVEEDTKNEEETAVGNFAFPEIALPDGMMRALSYAGAAVSAMAGVVAILSFFLPLMGFRTCALTGGCAEESTPYNTNSVYDQQGYGQTGYQYNNGFKRRSLEYVGPILKALSSAYDKYGPPAQATARKMPIVPVAHTK